VRLHGLGRAQQRGGEERVECRRATGQPRVLERRDRAFVVADDNTPDLERTDDDGKFYGGVPLGLQIAEDIFFRADGSPRQAPEKSTVPPLP